MSTKEALKQLRHLFNPSSASSSSSPFHALSLPESASAQIDTLLSQFAASFPLGGGGGHHRESEGEKERARWREGLLEIWGLVEPLPGTERETLVIARVSAFLVLLEKLSSRLGEDDDSALVSRKDIGTVWWTAILKRTMLGTAKEFPFVAGTQGTNSTDRGRKTALRGKGMGGESLRPLITSRAALQAATAMVVWSMAPNLTVPDHLADAITPFGMVVMLELEERSSALLKGKNEGYGVRNLEECVIGWGAKCTKAFFLHMSASISPNSPFVLSYLSLLVAFLSRHSGKAYHALKTPLLSRLNVLCLTADSSAEISLAIKSLAIFLVTLPVIIGPPLIGVMAVYGRVVCWERSLGEGGEAEDDTVDDGPPPDPLVLFTVLYGLYPCNFIAFLKDAHTYLKGKEWRGVTGNGEFGLDSAAIRERSKPLVRAHTLHPALINSDVTLELTDTNRWRQFEAADVMAECDRNVVHVGEVRDPRGDAPVNLATEEATYFNERGAHSVERGAVVTEDDDGERRMRDVVRGPVPASRSRSPTPHLPRHTHFTNFQALQTAKRNASSSSDRQSDLADPLSISVQLGMPPTSPTSSGMPSRATSRRGSFSNFSDGIMSRTNSTSKAFPTTSSTAANAQIARLETELILLQSEVNFQIYLKQLHLAHMGTLHREKVLDSGAEAERQSLYRTIRTLRAQLKQTKLALDKLRTESSVTKANWISHIDDLKDKLKSLRDHRLSKEDETAILQSDLHEAKGLVAKQAKELEIQGAEYFDLQNQVSLDSVKLSRIGEYEARIEALLKTLALCDEDLCKYIDQQKEMGQLVSIYQKSELLREATDAEVDQLRATLRAKDDEIAQLRAAAAAFTRPLPPPAPIKDDMSVLRKELERLRSRVMELEEANLAK